ncbi:MULTISPECIES: CobD/CbiB family protein [unclassified Rhizobacter]|uniref:CobD/CbiB family protein n=1 Tax=unclassified Rhizobacter TaxID=2640088 RepID=UPI0006FA6120|nr:MULTISPECIES: CobD/CbiB family protein [unclassified Rhizobacter]KQU71231.1 cobalamin biosynthesis protein CbiB [Rhizobacter sp. Root29]KQV97084.1 cobalamin biosynthesis protein CbiB [Rhizobacter sp. Root1238]KRB24156.1 cobalamin biosynthesis protein CbiB [Rhizobacter sp. Root16D2]
MSFFAVLFALLIEQLKPLPRRNFVHDGLTGWMRWTGRNFDAGQDHHAWVVWCVTTLVPALLAWGVFAVVVHFSLVAALAWNVVVLYLTMGFRQFSHYFTDIRDALERGDELTARRLLAEWRHLDASELPRAELLRHVIEHSLLAAHRHVFGVFFWFVVLSSLGLGPAGAVFYRMAEFASRYWAFKSRTVGAPVNERLLALSQRLFGLIDHLPARMTAFGFAVVGNFEEAVSCWRRDAGLWKHANEGIILSAAAGAVGVQLGGSAAPGVTPDRSKTFDSGAPDELSNAEGSTPGAPPQVGHLRSIVGLVWRSVVLWMLLLALLSLANLIG